MVSTFSAMTNLMKTKYVNNNFLYDHFQGVDPVFPRLLSQPLSGKTTGKSMTYPIVVNREQAIGSDFEKVQEVAGEGAAGGATFNEDVVIPFNADVYAIGRVRRKAEYATKDGQGAFVEAVEHKTTQVIDSLSSKYSSDVWRDGTGALGKISAINLTSKVVTLESKSDLWNIEGGMAIEIRSTNTAAGVLRGTDTKLYVSKVDRLAFTFTVVGDITANSSPARAVPAANDYVYPYGSGGKAVGINTFVGIGGWLPNAAVTSTSFYGMDRTVDRVRLAGWRVQAKSGASGSVLETIRRAVVLQSNFFRNAKDNKDNNIPVDCFLGSAAWEVLSDEYDDSVEMRRINTNDLATGTQGFTGLQILAGGRTIRVWSCPSLNPLVGYILNMKHWGLQWLGEGDKTPVMFQTMTNGTYFKDVEAAPEYEFRLQSHPILFCQAPGQQIVLDLSNRSTEINAYLSAT